MFARFDENPAMTLRVIKERKRYGRTDGRTDGQRENSIPPTNKVCGGYNKIRAPEGSPNVVLCGFMDKPGIEPATPGLQGIGLIHYTTGASLIDILWQTVNIQDLHYLLRQKKSSER